MSPDICWEGENNNMKRGSTKLVPAYLLVIPFLWSVVGMSAALNLRVPQDYGLVVAGVLGTTLIMVQNRKAKRPV
jgi:hypothetical protein